ncbi:TonB-dependent receptor [Tunturiibacter lichenicola]|uniref:TonB-dependent receptor n=1 Tax=Tunturiibacter lichenicola TaxID=2051959 RepID=UPI0021B278C1|nr:TonB-dependent receptor [Edaphobacter lichenicola]
MRTRFFHYLAGCLLAASVRVPVMMAQTITGSISGEVTDPTGAVVPNAKVTAENVDTGVKTQVTTNAAGVYSIRFLPIGHYKVLVEAQGFSSEAVPPFTLEINQTVKLNESLSVGATTTVEVDSGSAPILNTTDGTLGITVSTNEIATLPLNGRNFSSVTLFQPGAVTTSPQGFAGTNAIERNTLASGIASINGNRTVANNYTLDGIDINEGQNNLIGYTPSPDALAEIKVISANAPAAYGNVNGGDVVSVLKSGTNQFHGSAFAYLQNQTLNANTWSNNFQGNPINPYTQTQFGGTIGGPIWKNKLFFFADYEGAREHTGGVGSASVLTAAMRTGDFSAFPTPLFDSQNNFAPYTGNKNIPILNPVAKFLFAHPELYPLPNHAPTDGVVQNDFQGPQRSFKVNNQEDIKIEWNPNSADKITGFYAQSTAFDGSIVALPITFPAQNTFPSKLFGATWVHVFSPAIVNQARIGFTRVRWDDSVPTDPTGAFGLNGNSLVGIPFGAQQFVGFSFQGFGQDLNGNGQFGTPAAPQILRDNTFSYEDNLTWQRGKHLLSMGVQAIRYQQNYLVQASQGALGQFTYNGSFTGIPNATGGLTNGYSGADFVLDRVQQEQIQLPGALVGNRQWRAAAFFQDDWKVTDKLTFNLGVRYEFDQPWTEVNNKTANVLLSTGTVEYAKQVPVGAPAGSIVCDNPACYQPNYAQIMPRIGFAYQATSRFVVRGGYGATSFFEGNSNNQRLTFNSPFVQSSVLTATAPAVGNPGTPFATAQGFAISANSIQNVGFGAWPQNIKPAYINEFNLTTEFEINSKTSLTIGYVGETGQHIEDFRNANQLTTTQAASIAALNGAPLPASDVAPFASLVGQGGTLLLTESEAVMNYNALQASLRQRASKGFEYTINYTYAHALTNSAGNFAGLTDDHTQNGSFQDGYNGHADYGPASQDVRNNLSAIAVYAIPYGRGKIYGGDVNRAVDLLLGGWSISGTAIAYSGLPTSIFGPRSDNTNTAGDARANQFRKLIVRNRSVGHWFGTDPSAIPCGGGDNGTCAYGPEAPNSFGTAAVGTERAPGFEQIDTSVFKDFRIREGQAVGFRADAFNVFNFASYDNPNNNIGDPNFGQITGTRGLPREMQLSLHYNF